jgi:hypothetical protein
MTILASYEQTWKKLLTLNQENQLGLVMLLCRMCIQKQNIMSEKALKRSANVLDLCDAPN